MRVHIAIVWDSHDETLYAVPGRVLATYHDTIVVHAVNRDIEFSAADSKPFGEQYRELVSKLKGLVRRGHSYSLKVPGRGKVQPGIYSYKAYSPEEKVYAVGGSYPKVIIYD